MSDSFIVLKNEVFTNNLNYFIEKNNSKRDLPVKKNKNISIFSHSDKNISMKLNLFKLQKNSNQDLEKYFESEKETKCLHELYINNSKINNNNNNMKENNKKNSKFSITQSYYSYSEISSLDLNSSKSSDD